MLTLASYFQQYSQREECFQGYYVLYPILCNCLQRNKTLVCKKIAHEISL